MGAHVRRGQPATRKPFGQVLEHEWVTSEGGHVPVVLGRAVQRGMAKVARQRRFKKLVHGLVAANRLNAIVHNASHCSVASVGAAAVEALAAERTRSSVR